MKTLNKHGEPDFYYFTILQFGTAWVKYLAMLQRPIVMLVSQFLEMVSHLVYSSHKRAQ